MMAFRWVNLAHQFVGEISDPIFCWAKLTTFVGCVFALCLRMAHFCLRMWRSFPIFCWTKNGVYSILCRSRVGVDVDMYGECAWQRLPNRWVIGRMVRSRSDFEFSQSFHIIMTNAKMWQNR